ncbi:MAG: signal peptide peptidase SppA [Saprospiraceae bacterium]
MKSILSSCLGVFLAMIGIFVVSLLVLSSIISSTEKPPSVSPNTVLHLKLEEAIPEKTNNLEMVPFDFKETKILGLQDMLRMLETAKQDDKIKGIFIETDAVNAGLATASVLHNALEDFKSSGKFVYAYCEYCSQGAYYIASTADYIAINPQGNLDFRGFAAVIPFFKTMLDKIGVQMQVFYAGKFKSATEPFRRTEMSPENKLQTREYIEDAYQKFLSDISKSRNISAAELRRIADGYLAAMPTEAQRLKLVDAVAHRDEVISKIREKIGLKKDDKVNLIELDDYYSANAPSQDYSVKNKIAVIYAEGSIVDGKGDVGNIGDEKYVKILQRIRQDDRIKAVVLRVNSPGGSALASENILQEIKLTQDAGTPVVVSMGDYAASGGYYIAAFADTILAEPNTLTGSIGVFSVIPNAKELLNNKIGITVDTVKTGRFAHGITPFYEMSPEEQRIFQNMTDRTYETFLQRVSAGRNMTRDQVNEIAQGRVWTGNAAKRIGLVDEIGGLDKAIDIAAHLSGLKEHRVVEYPAVKDPWQRLIEDLTSEEEVRTERLLKHSLRDWYPYYQFAKEIQDSKGVQARLPFLVPFK